MSDGNGKSQPLKLTTSEVLSIARHDQHQSPLIMIIDAACDELLDALSDAESNAELAISVHRIVAYLTEEPKMH